MEEPAKKLALQVSRARNEPETRLLALSSVAPQSP